MYNNIYIDYRFGGERMFVGDVIKERMISLGMNASDISENTFIDESVINGLLENRINISDMDSIDVEFIAESLYCTPEYFIDSNIRNRDVLKGSLNRGKNSVKSNIIKAKIQSIMEDFSFMSDMYMDEESGV